MKRIGYFLEGIGLWIALLVFRCLPYRTASNFGGWIGRTIGPRLAASRKAYNNLAQALPGKPQADYDGYVRDMWDNLGRVIAEYPHLLKMIEAAEIVGEDHIQSLPESFVIIGGHLANWELLPFYFNYRLNKPITGIYRAPNNPYSEKLLDRCRNPENKGLYAPKSTGGSRTIIKTLQEGGRVGILIDQKYNQGLKADFFGRPAMTSPSFVQLARKYDCPIVPLWIERIDGAKCRLVIEPPFKVDNRSDDDMIAYAHSLLERHILKNPGQWLWLHRRWIT